jgi:hypothetical protein
MGRTLDDFNTVWEGTLLCNSVLYTKEAFVLEEIVL